MKLNKVFKNAYNNQSLEITLELDTDNTEEVTKRFNYFSNLLTSGSNIQPSVRLVEWIKTVFKGFREQSLTLNYQSRYLIMNISYLNGKLNSYYYDRNSLDFTMSYAQDKHITFAKPLDFENIELISVLLKDLMAFHNVQAQKLANDSLKLITIYKLFYQEYPDFSLEKTGDNFQNMVNILDHFGISTFIDGYKVIFNYEVGKMESAKLSSWLYEVSPFYQEDLTARENLIDIKEQMKIQAIANYLENNLGVSNLQDATSFLEKLSTMLYLQKEWYSEYLRTKEVSTTNYPKIIRDLKKVSRKVK